MTIEEEFFKAFGIEPKKTRQIVGDDLFFNVIEDEQYPEITDRKYFMLVLLLNKLYTENYQCASMFTSLTLEDLKREILFECLENKKHLKQQVKALFEGE
jgi:hypothetical protein